MSIVDNKKAFFDYFIEERYEAGLVLEGWEVKAIRAGRAQIKEAYVVVRNAEIFLIGSKYFGFNFSFVAAFDHAFQRADSSFNLLQGAHESKTTARQTTGKVRHDFDSGACQLPTAIGRRRALEEPAALDLFCSY